jgi:hypothetical protein
VGNRQLNSNFFDVLLNYIIILSKNLYLQHVNIGFNYTEVRTISLRPGCIKRCQFVVKVNILSSDLIGGYLTLNLNQPIKWANFRLDALLADTIL